MTTKLIAADANAGAILDPSVGDGTLVIQTGLAGAKVDAISIAADGTPTFLKVPKNIAAQSMVRLTGSNGYGSTNTAIWRLTTVVVNQGLDVTYVDSATLGASFTITAAGVYAIAFSMVPSGINGGLGISLNSSQLSINILSIAAADAVSRTQINTANTMASVSWTGYLAAGAVIRPHGDGAASGNTTAPTFTITRVA